VLGSIRLENRMILEIPHLRMVLMPIGHSEQFYAPELSQSGNIVI